MPVLFARWKPHDVASAYLLDRTARVLHPPRACSHDQCLAERMRVPGGACSWLERKTLCFGPSSLSHPSICKSVFDELRRNRPSGASWHL